VARNAWSACKARSADAAAQQRVREEEASYEAAVSDLKGQLHKTFAEQDAALERLRRTTLWEDMVTIDARARIARVSEEHRPSVQVLPGRDLQSNQTTPAEAKQRK